MHTEFQWGKLRERDHVQDLGVDGRVNLKWVFKLWDEGMGWIDLAQDRDRWRTFVNAVTKLRFQENGGNFLTI